jgi:carbon-monoxide dehydrogenase medium subunit
VYPPSFKLLVPASLEEALRMLSEHGHEAKVLAGGHSLIPLMKLRLARPAYVIYLGKLKELSYIREEGGSIRVGALTTHAEIESSQLLQEKCPLLAETASRIGDRQVRNMGTIGGSIAHADPAADYPAALLALEASVEVRSAKGVREVRVEDLIKGAYTTDLAPEELITEVRVPVLGGAVGTAYEKLVFRASDFAIVGVAALVSINREGVAERVRVGITGASDAPVRARGVEEELEGKKLTEESITEASRRASEGLNPPSDIRASGEYRKAMAEALTRRALMKALSKAREKLR